MDVISLGVAKKASKQEKHTRNNVLGSGVQGTHLNVKQRIDKMEKSFQDITRQADKLIVNDAINIMKAHAKLNSVARVTKYRMHNMLFDDLLDSSGIDASKSSGYAHDAVVGTITAGASCVIETKEETTDVIPSKVILTVEEYTPILIDVTPTMTSNATPAPYVASASSSYSSSFQAWRAFDGNEDTGWETLNGQTTGWLQLDFGSPTQIDSYFIAQRNVTDTTMSSAMPKNWTLLGSNDGVNWTTVDTRTDQTVWNLNRRRTFMLGSSVTFRYYRINVTANNGHAGSLRMYEMKFSGSTPDEVKGEYSISRDNGETWEPIKPDTLFYFTESTHPSDNKLRLKVKLPSGTQLLNYALTWV